MQVAECFLLVLASNQLSRLGEFLLRYLPGREPRREKIEFPADGDELGRLLTGKGAITTSRCALRTTR